MEQANKTDNNGVLDTLSEQYLTFRIDTETFAVEVFRVREVLDMIDITKVPNAPPFMCGMINVRGNVVPVMDMRLKFGMDAVQTTVDTRIIVMEVTDSDEESIIVGALADGVHEVTELEQSAVESAPKIGTQWNTEFIHGIGKREDEFIVILNADKVFSSDEIAISKQTQDVREELVEM